MIRKIKKMKKIIYLSVLTLFISAFTIKNSQSDNDGLLRTCEYSFYVKCNGSNQFVEIIRAKDLSTAKTMCKNRYKDCKVQTKSSNPLKGSCK